MMNERIKKVLKTYDFINNKKCNLPGPILSRT